MRKMCVKRNQWALIAVVAATISQTLIGTTTSAQSSEPLLLPRLSFSDLAYQGGFRLPADASNDDSFSYGGQAVAFNAAGPSLFVRSLKGRVAEVTIPAPVVSADVNDMSFAEYLQGFADPTEGRISQVGNTGVSTTSLLVHNGRLFGTASVYYDALNEQRVSHFSRSLRLNNRSFQGWSQVWETGRTGFVAGNLASVPQEWQSRLGGAMISGQCCVPIVSRTSWGPSAFAFDPTTIGQSVVPASPLLYYTGDHPTLGSWDAKDANPLYNLSTEMGGMVVVAGTRTALYFGRTGTGKPCYGKGTADTSLVGTTDPTDGGHWCYDPTSIDKGTHAYPYQYQIWAYDLNDFAAVKAGTKKPWDVVPYDVWPFAFPTEQARIAIGGVSYDAATQTIYVAQTFADTDVYAFRPIIHVLRVNGTGNNLAPTTPIDPVTGVTLTADKHPPQRVGTAITFTATSSGGEEPNQFKWLVFENGAWVIRSNWSTADRFTWSPAAAQSQYQVAVWARSSRSTADRAEAVATVDFPIEDTNNANPVTGVSMSANRTAPQQPGTAITFSANASGGPGHNHFKWLVFDGSRWTTQAEWGTAPTFTWTPSIASSQYQVRVWARRGTSTADQPQAMATISFPISSPTAAPTPVSRVTMASTTSPQVVGTTLSFAATPTGGTAPYQFKWRVFDGASWSVRADWGVSNSFTWTPSTPNNGYRIEVWARSAGNTSDAAEASVAVPFVVVASGGVKSVALSSNLSSPQSLGASVRWLATVGGAAGTLEYRWSIYDGSKWTAIGGWGPYPTFTWTPQSKGDYQVSVAVRSAGNTAAEGEVSATKAFSIK